MRTPPLPSCRGRRAWTHDAAIRSDTHYCVNYALDTRVEELSAIYVAMQKLV